MKLYRAKVPQIAHDVLATLVADGDIEVQPDNRAEAERDLVAIMEEYLRRDRDLTERTREHMAHEQIDYNERGRTRKRLAEEQQHPVGEDVEKFLARQFAENLMISRYIDEVYQEDAVLYKKLLGLLRSHDVDERQIVEEARGKVKNIVEGTIEYEIALENAKRDVRKRRGLS